MSVTLQSVNIHTYTQGTRVGEYGALRTLSFKIAHWYCVDVLMLIVKVNEIS